MPRLEGKDNSGGRWAIGLGLVVILGGLAYLALGGPRAGTETIDTNIARPMPPRRPDAIAGGLPATNAATDSGAAANGTPDGPASPNGSVTGTDSATQSNAANPTGSTTAPANPAANPTPLVGEAPGVNPDAPNGPAQNGAAENGVGPNGATPRPGTMGGASVQNVPPPPGVAAGSGSTSPGAP